MAGTFARSVLLTLIVALLAGCTIGGVDVEQEQASGLAGELLDGHSLGQTLTLEFDGLYRIDLYTATYARENTHPIIFRLRTVSGIDKDLVRVELPAAQISNSGPTAIVFPPLAGTAGQTLYFSLESPGAVPGDAVTVYRHEENIYAGGEMHVDGRPAGGDLAFIAYTQERFSLAEIWRDFYTRARRDGALSVLYCSFLALLLVALAVVPAWPRQKPAADEGGEAKDNPPARTNPVPKEDR